MPGLGPIAMSGCLLSWFAPPEPLLDTSLGCRKEWQSAAEVVKALRHIPNGDSKFIPNNKLAITGLKARGIQPLSLSGGLVQVRFNAGWLEGEEESIILELVGEQGATSVEQRVLSLLGIKSRLVKSQTVNHCEGLCRRLSLRHTGASRLLELLL